MKQPARIITAAAPNPMVSMAGLSLIELMIALVLGVILTLGATQIYLGTSQTYRLTDAVAHTQENVRFAISMIERDVRAAGGLGCLQYTENIDVKLTGNRAVEVGDGITGWEADGTGIGDEYVVDTELAADASGWSEGTGTAVFPAELVGDVVAGTDILIVNSVETIDVDVTGSSPGRIDISAASGIPQGRIVLAIDDNCGAGELFQKANADTAHSITIAGAGFDPGNLPASTFDLDYGDEGKVAAYTTVAYYIGIGAGGEPALFMQRLDTEPEPPLELVEGVESLQVLYGVALDDFARNVGFADNYVTADDVDRWTDVMSVRVAFMMRSGDGANSENQARTFNLLGTEATSQADRRARLIAASTIGLRNRLE